MLSRAIIVDDKCIKISVCNETADEYAGCLETVAQLDRVGTISRQAQIDVVSHRLRHLFEMKMSACAVIVVIWFANVLDSTGRQCGRGGQFSDWVDPWGSLGGSR